MASYHIIGGDTKEYGPISAEDIQLWIGEGRLNAQSLAKAEGDTAWRTLASFPEFAAALRAAPPTLAPPTPPAFSAAKPDANWEAEVLARKPELRLGECLAAGWSFLGANAGFMVGAVFLTWITNFLFVIISLAVPLLGPLILLCFIGVIMGGFCQACLRRMRGEPVPPTEVFCGFKIAFAQLLLTGLVGMLLTQMGLCCFVLPAIYLGVAWAFALPLVTDKKMLFWPALELSRKVVTRVWFEAFVLVLVAFLPTVIFQIFNAFETGQYLVGLYDQADHSWQQFAQLVQSQTGEMEKFSFKLTLIGQGVFLLNLFYIGGVLMRAYENLFGPRKS